MMAQGEIYRNDDTHNYRPAYYLVCMSESLGSEEIRLVNLRTGSLWSRDKLHASDYSKFTKVDNVRMSVTVTKPTEVEIR